MKKITINTKGLMIITLPSNSYFSDWEIEEDIKPPLGLKPKRVHDIHRVNDIIDAIKRYINTDKVVPDDWRDELDDLLYSLNDFNGFKGNVEK